MVDQASAPARDVTVPLLDRIIEESLDQDYQEAADRRAEKARLAPDSLESDLPTVPSAAPGRSAWVVLAVFGLLVGTAAVQSAQSADATEVERSSLVAQIEIRRDRVAEQQQELTDLRALTRGLDSEIRSLAQQERAAEATIDRLEPPTGFAPVSGPGLRLVINDAADGEDSGLVRADDLSMLVNGLWAAGAEAISIDDQRLTTLTSLRNSGLTIGVNQVSLRAPYTVKAIGNPRTLEANLLDSTSGLAWESLVDEFGFRVQRQTETDMSLPADRSRPLRAATVKQDTAQNEPGQEERP